MTVWWPVSVWCSFVANSRGNMIKSCLYHRCFIEVSYHHIAAHTAIMTGIYHYHYRSLAHYNDLWAQWRLLVTAGFLLVTRICHNFPDVHSQKWGGMFCVSTCCFLWTRLWPPLKSHLLCMCLLGFCSSTQEALFKFNCLVASKSEHLRPPYGVPAAILAFTHKILFKATNGGLWHNMLTHNGGLKQICSSKHACRVSLDRFGNFFKICMLHQRIYISCATMDYIIEHWWM